MTRINIGIPPCDLTDQHLLAEFRELPRIPNRVKKLICSRKDINNIPSSFCLGTGHVKFFYDKLEYLHKRYFELQLELKFGRGFNIIEYDDSLFSIKQSKFLNDKFLDGYNDYTPTSTDIELIKSRITIRILNSKQQPRYYRQNIDKEEYINNILKFKS